MNKIFVSIAIVGIIALCGLFLPQVSFNLAGTTHFSGPVDSDAGFSESGTTIISTSKALSNITTISAATTTITGSITATEKMYEGGDVTTLASSTHQLTAVHICDNTLLKQDTDASATAIYLPTSDQLVADCLPDIGDWVEVVYDNTCPAADTCDNTITASGTIDLIEPSGGDVVIQSATAEKALIRCINDDGTTSVACIVTSLQAAD